MDPAHLNISMNSDSETTAIKTILFDLDGTLLDTAPDLAFALNQVRTENALEPLPFEQIRPVVSHGGIALIRLGFDIETDHPEFEPLRKRLLDIYRENIARETTPFPGMDELLDTIEDRGMNWGVVTNKPTWLTLPLLEQIGYKKRAACIVCGDTLEQRKPHPAPMHYACELAGSTVNECIYIGDAHRDIDAGKQAGMKTLVALFGYIGLDEDVMQWDADGLVEQPQDILKWIDNLQTS
jgi:phosphoglycolate phosphatase